MKTPSRIFKKYTYDIALEDGVGRNLVSWITGLMVFFMTLALCVNLALNALADTWVSDLSGSLTIEIPPPPAGKNLTNVQRQTLKEKSDSVLQLASSHPAVSSARALTETEIRALVEPWLGGKISGDLPLPALIDIRLSGTGDVAALQNEILTLTPEATVDTHQETLDDIGLLISAARTFVVLLTAVIALLAAAAIAGIVRAKLAIHHDEVETLHLIGASDEYIARQFRRHTLKGTVKGALGGVACMLLTLFALAHVTRGIDAAILPQVDFTPLYWAALVLGPLALGAVIAHVTAQATVARTLAKLP